MSDELSSSGSPLLFVAFRPHQMSAGLARSTVSVANLAPRPRPQRSVSVHRLTRWKISGYWLNVEFLTSSRREDLTPDVLLSTMQRSIHRRSLVGRYGRVVSRSPLLVHGSGNSSLLVGSNLDCSRAFGLLYLKSDRRRFEPSILMVADLFYLASHPAVNGMMQAARMARPRVPVERLTSCDRFQQDRDAGHATS